MTTDHQGEQLAALSKREHSHCIICGAANEQGLRLHFTVCPDGSVTTVFPCRKTFQGYKGILHGGVISGLLDSAMTNCLFSMGLAATTGELLLRFLHPVTTDLPATVTARMKRSHPPLHIVQAELHQNGKLLVRATGKFMEFRTEGAC